MAAGIGIHGPKLPEYTGEVTQDFNMWFRKFELFHPQLGEGDDWQPRNLVLPLYLSGQAFSTFDALDAETKGDYDLLKAALRERLVPGEHNLLRRQSFMSLVRIYAETPSAFELRVSKEAEAAYADFAEEARRALAKEQFIRGIGDPELQLHLLTQNPANLRAAAQIAEQYEQVKRVSGTTSAVRGVQQENSEIGVLRKEMRLLMEAVEKLLARQEQADARSGGRGRQQNDSAQRFNGNCNYCGRFGHKKVDCWHAQPKQN